MVHNAPKRTPPHKQTHTTHTTPPPPPGRGVESKPSKTTPLSPTLCHAKAAARCKPEQLPGLLHNATITLKPHGHDRPSAPMVHQQNTLVAASINTTNPSHSTWRPRLSQVLSIFPRYVAMASLELDGAIQTGKLHKILEQPNSRVDRVIIYFHGASYL